MKTRHVITTFEVHEIQKQLNKTKHKKARELLESRLKSTYLESYVDLEKKKATLICNRDYASDKVKENINEMCKEILDNYPQIKIVDVYGYTELIKAGKNGMEFPKSSVLQPELENDNNSIPSFVINGIDEIHCDKDTREDAQIFMDLKDNTLQKLGFAPVSEMVGDREAGEIRIIIEESKK